MPLSIPHKVPSKGWNAFRHHLARISKLWLWIALLLFISRLLLVWMNRNSMDPETSFTSYLLAFFTGFRFDMPVATLLLLPNFLAASLGILIPINKVTNALRSVTFYLSTILWVIITTITLGYFKEYHSQFDANLLGLVYDDFGAVIKTIWSSYPVIVGGLIMTLICTVLIMLGRRWIRSPYPFKSIKKPTNAYSGIGITLLILAAIVLTLRGGSMGGHPMQRKVASQTKDLVLNRCVMNSFYELKYAIRNHKNLMSSHGLDVYLKKDLLLSDFREYAGNKDIKTIDEAFLRTAKGRAGSKPRHIFLIVMESYDGWSMFDKHDQWNISNGLKSIGKEGIYVQDFLPASHNTITSLGSIIGGLAEAGVFTHNRSRPSDKAYPTALASQMKKLGYETHLWYSGYGSWARIDDFSKEQGFDHSHTGSSMDSGQNINQWGCSDECLFTYAEENVNLDKPTFNLILTTSNHPPFSIDLKKDGCPLTAPPADYREDLEQGSASIASLGHHWYSDKWMSKFVRSVSKDVPGSLFAITGDHWSRRFPGSRPTVFEKATVPLVLYGPGLIPSNLNGDKLRGSHYDLGTTLIELAAPSGFQYHAIGRNILETKPDDVAMSRLWMLSNNAISSTTGKQYAETLEGQKLDSVPVNLQTSLRQYNLTHGISWWRICNGNELPKK